MGQTLRKFLTFDGQGRICRKKEEIQNLRDELVLWKRDYQQVYKVFEVEFKKLVPDEIYDGTEAAGRNVCHRLYPRCLLRDKLLKQVIPDSRQLKEFLDSAAIRDLVTQLDQEFVQPVEEIKRRIHAQYALYVAAILWYPNILVKGPAPERDDRGDGVDQSLLNHQTAAYKNLFEAFTKNPNLDTLGSLEPTTALVFREQGNKFVAAGAQSH